jgi:hypothetical protein
VFQAHFTTFLIEPGYEKPITIVEQIIKSAGKFGFNQGYQRIFPDSSDSVDSTILKKALCCPNEDTCFSWATAYRDFSTILDDFSAEYYRPNGKWTDENNIPLLRELEDGVIRTHGNVFLISNGGRLFELIATCRRRSIS